MDYDREYYESQDRLRKALDETPPVTWSTHDDWTRKLDQAVWDRYSACKRAGLIPGPDGLPENWRPSEVPDSLEAWCRGEE